MSTEPLPVPGTHSTPVPTTDGPLHIVFNLGSGAGDAERAHAAIQQACAEAGREFHLISINDPGQLPARAREAVQRAQQADGVVVAAGGDGTLNAVAQAVLGSGCAFGVLPQGTFNYFGRTHGIPADTALAMQVLLHAPVMPVQVGRVNDRVFLVNASLGLYPKLLEEREGWKQQFGRSRVVAFGAGLATLLGGYRSLRLRIEVEGRVRDVRTPTLFVGNNALQMEQLGFPLAQAIDHGALAAIMLRPVGRLAMLALVLRGAFGRLGDADQLLSLACVQLTVRPARRFGTRPVKVATDGEIVWLPLPLQFAVAPEPLWLIRPDTPAPERAAP
jgi:diacylglycerol kinase family enzyme